MQRKIFGHQVMWAVVALTLALALFSRFSGSGTDPAAGDRAHAFIVQAATSVDAGEVVTRVGGRVTDLLDIINAVGAELTTAQVERIRSLPGPYRVYTNSTVKVSGGVGEIVETHYPTLVGARTLHDQGITGQGVTIAFLDTGIWETDATELSAIGKRRILAQYDATVATFVGQFLGGWSEGELNVQSDDDDDDDGDEGWESRAKSGWDWWQRNRGIDDFNGHGTHVTSIAVSSARTASGNYQGIAPNANVVAVRAFGPDGSGSYLNVVRALDWIVEHADTYDIRVLNLSFGGPPRSNYWDDPVNQAVMAAWEAGIIVVASAGNGGPGPMTVGVPGNVPYVITVGAMTDSYTPGDTSDDRLATFSAAGPTYEGFVKPEIVAPGGHMLGEMPPYGWIPLAHPEYIEKVGDYVTMSGTSQSAAVVSGIAALLVEAEPDLSPDEAKCRLLASARPARFADGSFAYSVFQQGTGRVDAAAALLETRSDCANLGLNVEDDLDGSAHFLGPADVDANGTYYLVDGNGERWLGGAFEWQEGALWHGGAIWNQGNLWNEGNLWNDGNLWNQGNPWPQGRATDAAVSGDGPTNLGVIWPEGNLWNQGNLPISTSVWVDQE